MSSYRCPLIVVGVGTGFVVVGAVPVAVSYSIGVRSSATMIGMGFVGFGFLLLAPGLVWCIAIRTLHGFKSWRRRSMRRQQGGNQSTVSSAAGGIGGAGDGCEVGESDDEEGGEAVGGGGSSTNGRYRSGARAEARLGPSSHGCRPGSAGAANGRDGDGDGEPCDGDPGVRRSGSRQQRRNRSWPSSYSEPPNLIVTDHLVCDASSVPQPTPPPPPSHDETSPLPPLSAAGEADQDPSPTGTANDVFTDIIAVCDVIVDGPTPPPSSFKFPSPGVASCQSRSTSGSMNDVVVVVGESSTSAVVEIETLATISSLTDEQFSQV